MGVISGPHAADGPSSQWPGGVLRTPENPDTLNHLRNWAETLDGLTNCCTPLPLCRAPRRRRGHKAPSAPSTWWVPLGRGGQDKGAPAELMSFLPQIELASGGLPVPLAPRETWAAGGQWACAGLQVSAHIPVLTRSQKDPSLGLLSWIHWVQGNLGPPLSVPVGSPKCSHSITSWRL